MVRCRAGQTCQISFRSSVGKRSRSQFAYTERIPEADREADPPFTWLEVVRRRLIASGENNDDSRHPRPGNHRANEAVDNERTKRELDAIHTLSTESSPDGG